MRDHLDAAFVRIEDRLSLGHWLQFDEGRHCDTQPAFIALMGKHAELHALACSVVRHINARSCDDAERLIGMGSGFAQISIEVCSLLTSPRHAL